MLQSLAVSQKEYLSKNQTTALKGMLALCVLLCHVVPASGVFQGSILSPLFGSLGYLSVAVFFFLSGYGIAVQYQAKKEYYLKTFLKNRVASIYCLTLFLTILYGVFRILVGVRFSLFEILQSLLIGNTIVSNGWYLQIVLLFYILWYLTTKHIKDEQARYAALCVAVLLYMLIGMLFLAHFWFQSSLGFLLGVFWQRNKQRLDNWLFFSRKRVFAVLSITVIAFCITYLLASKGFIPHKAISAIFRSVMSCLSAALFVVLVLMFNMLFGKVFNCNALQFVGKLSMEIYVLQGIPLHIFKTGKLSIGNGWLYIVCVIAVTVLLSIAMHPIIQFVTNIPKKAQGGP